MNYKEIVSFNLPRFVFRLWCRAYTNYFGFNYYNIIKEPRFLTNNIANQIKLSLMEY